MSILANQHHSTAEATAINPLHAILRLSNIIQTLDYMLARPDSALAVPDTRRRTVFVRNTLVVGLDLWQDDAHRRISKSRETFYVYCMTAGEQTAFLRRMAPGLHFAAEELRNIKHAALTTLAASLDQVAGEATLYGRENKACLQQALRGEINLVPHTHPGMALPPSSDDV